MIITTYCSTQHAGHSVMASLHIVEVYGLVFWEVLLVTGNVKTFLALGELRVNTL